MDNLSVQSLLLVLLEKHQARLSKEIKEAQSQDMLMHSTARQALIAQRELISDLLELLEEGDDLGEIISTEDLVLAVRGVV